MPTNSTTKAIWRNHTVSTHHYLIIDTLNLPPPPPFPPPPPSGLFLGPQELKWKQAHTDQPPPGMPMAMWYVLYAASIATPAALAMGI
jgi:hypothetical protein